MLDISLCGSCRNLRMCVFSGISYSMMSMASTPPRGLRLSRINAAHFAATTAKDCRALVMQIWLPLRVWFSYWVYAASKVTSKCPIGACRSHGQEAAKWWWYDASRCAIRPRYLVKCALNGALSSKPSLELSLFFESVLLVKFLCFWVFPRIWHSLDVWIDVEYL